MKSRKPGEKDECRPLDKSYFKPVNAKPIIKLLQVDLQISRQKKPKHSLEIVRFEYPRKGKKGKELLIHLPATKPYAGAAHYQQMDKVKPSSIKINLECLIGQKRYYTKVDWSQEPPLFETLFLWDTSKIQDNTEELELASSLGDKSYYFDPRNVLNWVIWVMNRADLPGNLSFNVVQVGVFAKRRSRSLIITLNSKETFSFGIEEMQRSLKQQRLKQSIATIDTPVENVQLWEQQKQFNIVLNKIYLCNREQAVSVMNEILPEIIERMCDADSLFQQMYKEMVYTGSYYEKLRIKDANEFDINLVLDLPTQYIGSVQMEWSLQPPAYAFMLLDEDVEDMGLEQDEEKWINSFLDDNDYLEPQGVLDWFQSVVDRARLTDIIINDVSEIICSSSGPARTLIIVLYDSTEISVDLVPVFKFHYKDWPEDLRNYQQSIVEEMPRKKRNLYLVPKVYKASDKQRPHEPAQSNIDRIWRINFTDMEKEYLNIQPEAKPVIKLLKLLRDSQGWTFCHSYFLKALVLKEISDNPREEWERKDLAKNMFKMMEKLKDCIEKEFLPHFFFQSFNLFQSFTDGQFQSMARRLQNILEDIAKDPDTIEDYFVAE